MARTQPLRRERIGLPLKDHDPTVTRLAPLFEAYLHAKRGEHGPRTRKDLRDGFGLFCRFLVGRGVAASIEAIPVSAFSLEAIEAYRDELKVRPALPGNRVFEGAALSAHSQHTYLRPLRQLGDYLAWAGWIEISPFELSYGSLLPSLDRAKRILKLAHPDDVRRFLDATRGLDPLSLRDHAIVLVAWETGMRTQDLVRLDLADVDLATAEVTIRNSKGENDRMVKLGELSMRALGRYLRAGRPALVARGRRRAGRKAPEPTALFVSEAIGSTRTHVGRHDGRLTKNGLYLCLQRRWHEAGGTGSFGAHRFRHGLATLLSEANVSLQIVAAWLGDSLETIRNTYAHPSARGMHLHVGPVVASSLAEAGYQAPEVA